MAVSQISFFTNATEVLATAAGAGILLAGFLAGSVGMATGVPRVRRDELVVSFGYSGGAVAVLLALLDLAMR